MTRTLAADGSVALCWGRHHLLGEVLGELVVLGKPGGVRAATLGTDDAERHHTHGDDDADGENDVHHVGGFHIWVVTCGGKSTKDKNLFMNLDEGT